MRKTPKYYLGKYKQIEALDVVLDFQENNYNLGTALTYIMRAGKKPNNPMSQDIMKAIVHLQAEYDHQVRKEANKPEVVYVPTP
jgi:hypothetical protein